MVAISTAIIASNIVNLLVWSRVQGVSRTTRVFLLNLTTSDLLVGVIACASSVYPTFSGRWPYGSVWCQISGVVHGASVTISIWSISMIGIDRYMAVTRPHTYRHLAFVRGSGSVVVVLWTVAIVTFVAPIVVERDFVYYKYNSGVNMCGMQWEHPMYCVISSMYIPIPSAIILVYTVVRIRTLLAREHDSLRKRCNRRVFRILVAASLTYFICWGPYVTVTLVTVVSSLRPPAWLSFCTLWLANANSFVNVFVYSVSSPPFRRCLRRLIVRPLCCSSETVTETESSTDSIGITFERDTNGSTTI